MKRVTLFAALFALLPLAAFAQRVPPPPPAPPAPPAAQVAPIPPLPPMTPFPPMLVDQMAIEDAIRMARDKMSLIDMDSLRLDSLKLDGLKFAMSDDMRALEQQAKVMATQSAGQAAASKERAAEMAARASDMQMTMSRSIGGGYEGGLSALGARDYERAIARFDQVIAAKDTRADGAMYHKAFAQFRLGKTDEAQATINELRKSHPQSRYLGDAKALEADVKKQAGHPIRPEDVNNDDDMKILAIQGIQNSDPARATPLLQGVLTANNALKVKQRALFMLALNDQPEAHKILLDYAKGAGNPDLQRQAISYLATGSGRKQTTSSELQEIYNSTQDVEVKKAIIDAWRSSGDTNAIFKVAGIESTPLSVRQQAIGGLGVTELWSLYQKETNHDLKMQMLGNFGSMGAFEQLSQVAKTEKDPALRQRAIRSLGNMKAEKSGALLVELYGGDADKDTRKSVASALENQNNVDGLIAIARKETDSSLKLDVVRHIANLASHNKAAMDYLMEIVK